MTASIPRVTLLIPDEERAEDVELLLGSVGVVTRRVASPDRFLETYEASPPECLVLAARLPGMSGLRLQQRLSAQAPTLPLIFVAERPSVAAVVRALRAGAADFFEFPLVPETFLDAVQSALEESVRALQGQRSQAELEDRLRRLTPRERGILPLVAAGLPSKAVGTRLRISKKTVDVHRASLMRKLEASSLADLVRIAVRLGICT